MTWARQALEWRWSHIKTLGDLIEYLLSLGLDRDKKCVGVDKHGAPLFSSEYGTEYRHAKRYCRFRVEWAHNALWDRFEELNCSNYWDLVCHFNTPLNDSPELRSALRLGLRYIEPCRHEVG